MLTRTLTYGTGYAPSAAAETFVVYGNRDTKVDAIRPGGIFAHSLGTTATLGMANPGTNDTGAFQWTLAERGVPVFAGDFAGASAFGNADSLSRVTDGISFFRTAGYASSSKKIIATGQSMGGLTILNYARANPTAFSMIALAAPAINLQDLYDNNRSDTTAFISAAYGGVPNYSLYSPWAYRGSFPDIPMIIFYSEDDPVCIPTYTQQFAAATGATLVSLGSVGHAVTGLLNHRKTFMDFVQQYGL